MKERFSFHLEVVDLEEGKIFDTAYNCDNLQPVIQDLELFAKKLGNIDKENNYENI